MPQNDLTVASLYALPPTVPVSVADEVLGIGQTLSKRLRAQGRYPLRILPGIGRHHRVSTADLLTYLGLPLEPPSADKRTDESDQG